MKLFETYIVRRVGMMFLVALLPVLAIIWTTQVLQRINLVTDSGQSMGSFAKLATLILPTIIPIVLPFALVIGITQTLTAMNSDSELTVMEAAGAKRSIIIRPIMILAIAISAFSFFVDNVVEPKARVAARNVRRDGMDNLKADEKKGEISEDERKRAETEVQKLTDATIADIDAVAQAKEKEILGK